MTPLLERKKALVVCVENEYAVAKPMNEGVLLLVVDLDHTAYGGNTATRQRMKEHLGGNAEVNVGPMASLVVTLPWSGSGQPPVIGTSVTAPAFTALLRGCRVVVVEDLDAGEVRLEPTSDGDGDSLTLYYRHDGQQQRIKGARGNVTGTGETEGMPTLQVTLQGQYERMQLADALTLEVANQADEIPVNYANTTLSILGHDAIGEAFSFDMGNTVSHKNKMGLNAHRVSNRDSSGQMTFQAPRIDEFDFFELIESHQEVAVGAVVFQHGTQPGNIVGFRTVKTQLSGLADQDDEGETQYQVTAKHLPDAGDDEWVMFFK